MPAKCYRDGACWYVAVSRMEIEANAFKKSEQAETVLLKARGMLVTVSRTDR